MTSMTAQDEMIRQRGAKSGQNAIDQLRVIAGLCNSSEFDAASSHLPLPKRKINGDASDQAILRFSEHLRSVSDLKRMWVKNFELAFNSKNKYIIRILSLANKTGLCVALPSDEACQFQEGDM